MVGTCSSIVLFISIHAPTRGATDRTQEDVDRVIISIHAPTRGATTTLLFDNSSVMISIHAPTRGATYRLAIEDHYSYNFNPRSYKRSDHRQD